MTKPKTQPARTTHTADDDSVPVSSLSNDLRTRIIHLCTEIQHLKAEIEPFTAAKDELQRELDLLMQSANLWDVSIPDLKCKALRTTRTMKTLKPELLLDNGVGMDVIERCTIVSTTTYCQVKRLGKDKDKTEK